MMVSLSVAKVFFINQDRVMLSSAPCACVTLASINAHVPSKDVPKLNCGHLLSPFDRIIFVYSIL